MEIEKLEIKNKNYIYQKKYRESTKGKEAIKRAVKKYSQKATIKEKNHLKYLDDRDKIKKYNELIKI